MHSLLQHEKFQSAPGSRVGTPAYLAPEVIMTTKGQTYDGKVLTCCSSRRGSAIAAVASGCLHLDCFADGQLSAWVEKQTGLVCMGHCSVDANCQLVLPGAKCQSMLSDFDTPIVCTRHHLCFSDRSM